MSPQTVSIDENEQMVASGMALRVLNAALAIVPYRPI
jgi:hypothetical protein